MVPESDHVLYFPTNSLHTILSLVLPNRRMSNADNAVFLTKTQLSPSLEASSAVSVQFMEFISPQIAAPFSILVSRRRRIHTEKTDDAARFTLEGIQNLNIESGPMSLSVLQGPERSIFLVFVTCLEVRGESHAT